MFFPGCGLQMERTKLINPTVLKATFSVAFSLVGWFLYHRSKRNCFPSSSSSSSLSSQSSSSSPQSLSSSSSDGSSEENYITSNEYDESDSSHEGHPQEALLEHVSSLFLKLEAMEADHLRRLEALVSNCPTVEEELREARARIMVLEHMIISRSKKKEQLPRLRQRVVILQARVAAKSRNEREMRRNFSEIKELKDEVAELRLTNVKLQDEKGQLVNKLSKLESLTSSMGQRHLEAERAMETYAQRLRITNGNLLKQIEQLQMSRSPDLGEVLYLRWSNACLRYELARKQGEAKEEEKRVWETEEKEKEEKTEEEGKRVWEIEEKEKEEKTVEYEEEVDDKSISLDMGECSSTAEMGDIPLDIEPKIQANITKRRFCHKLKRWAKGSGNRYHT